jgi:hypothetical protein
VHRCKFFLGHKLTEYFVSAVAPSRATEFLEGRVQQSVKPILATSRRTSMQLRFQLPQSFQKIASHQFDFTQSGP